MQNYDSFEDYDDEFDDEDDCEETNLPPSEFYFCDITNSKNCDFGNFGSGISFFLIVAKKFFDTYKYHDDRSCYFYNILPPGFEESMESVFETLATPAQARQQLLNAGFIENLALDI